MRTLDKILLHGFAEFLQPVKLAGEDQVIFEEIVLVAEGCIQSVC